MRIPKLAAGLVLTVVAAGHANAQAPVSQHDGPSFECSEAESEVEKLVCADPDLSALDWRLEERFTAAVMAIEGFAGNREAAEAELRSAQRGWVSGRDECWKADSTHDCAMEAYLLREAQLVALFMLETPASVVRWTCGGNPANEVVTYLFDTELPSLRIERGDAIDAAVLVPAGSGSKYAASFGREFWMRGEVATYREADPDGTSIDCVVAG
jgi:uncharacterized protein